MKFLLRWANFRRSFSEVTSRNLFSELYLGFPKLRTQVLTQNLARVMFRLIQRSGLSLIFEISAVDSEPVLRQPVEPADALLRFRQRADAKCINGSIERFSEAPLLLTIPLAR